jgi:hypothetical protein
MATQVLGKPDFNAIGSRELPKAYAARISFHDAGSVDQRNPKFLRGILFALGFEAIAALCVYGMWQAWLILR